MTCLPEAHVVRFGQCALRGRRFTSVSAGPVTRVPSRDGAPQEAAEAWPSSQLKPVRILMFARYLPPEYSGAAAQAFLLANRLRAHGHHVEFTTQSWSGGARTYEVDGFPITALPMRLSARHQEFGVWRHLGEHLWARRRHIDILHGQGAYYTQSILGPFGRALGKPTLVKASLSQNDLSSLSNSTIAPVHRWFLRRVDAYVAISEALKREFEEKGFESSRIWHIPNGVDLERFTPVREERRRAVAEALGLPADRPLGLFVGVFDDRKRIEWLLKNWVARRGFGTDVHLVAVGPTSRDADGPELKRELEDLAAQNPDLMTVRDFSPDIVRHYQAASLLLFPSRKEGLPNTVLEAMACGLPCLVARAPGSGELVKDGENGITFEIDDADALGRALPRVLAERDEFGAAGRRMAEERFGIGAVAERYEALYERLLGERQGPE
jgi:glycosyltransferase involved in cell wall biosynthesis